MNTLDLHGKKIIKEINSLEAEYSNARQEKNGGNKQYRIEFSNI